ncbi:hypothetical protein ANN_10516 [Periplaneta americana]|uniref:Uncharacterized protein n=1 Tax=Periplaneta americana TaxID=6978 RepID=A0ABQ8TT40_PERAM|nr:hypothetical protein ANN_10516 [Periplaneta americana]
MSGEEYNACSSVLCNFLHSPVTSSLLAPNILLSTLFSDTLNLCSSLKVRSKFHNHTEQPVEKFKYLGATVTNINDTREEIKHRMNMGNACHYSVEKLLSSILLSKSLKVRIYKTVILPVVLYGCETWTLTLREEHKLRVFETKVLRKIFGAKRDEVTGEWRKLHNTELHALYSSPDIIRNIKSRRLRWAGHVARMGESRNAYRVLIGRPEGKKPLRRPRRRWEDNIKMDLREVLLLIGVCLAAEEQQKAPESPSYPYPYATNRYQYVAYAPVPVTYVASPAEKVVPAPSPATHYVLPAPAVYYSAPASYVVQHVPSSAPPVGASVYYGKWQN